MELPAEEFVFLLYSIFCLRATPELYLRATPSCTGMQA